ncbi:hypothetical protein EDB83DRAFT_2332438 [Lactarius deliciosus]|nr:hypothetical protein EDB83DRAFT_2332438 [Lactarius deliciosus]
MAASGPRKELRTTQEPPTFGPSLGRGLTPQEVLPAIKDKLLSRLLEPSTQVYSNVGVASRPPLFRALGLGNGALLEQLTLHSHFGGSSPYQRGQPRSWNITGQGPSGHLPCISTIFTSHLDIKAFPKLSADKPTNWSARSSGGSCQRARRNVRVHTRASRTIDP